MRKLRFAILTASTLVIAACGASEPNQGASQADEFAARIKGPAAPPAASDETAGDPEASAAADGENGAAPAKASIRPSITYSEPVSGTGGPSVPGTASDPNASICGAPAVAPFLGRNADQATRAEIVAAVGSQNEVRFVIPGSTFINPDPTSSRLNVMIDNTGVIRDARCG